MKLTTTAMVLALSASAVYAQDKVTIEFAYPYSHLFDVTYEAMMPAFNAAHPNIEVKFRATYESYEDGTNTILREAVAGNLPDVTMQGLNRQQPLIEKSIAQSLEPFIAQEADFEKDGYHQAMLHRRVAPDMGRRNRGLRDHEGQWHRQPDLLGLEHHRQLVCAGALVVSGQCDCQRWPCHAGQPRDAGSA